MLKQVMMEDSESVLVEHLQRVNDIHDNTYHTTD